MLATKKYAFPKRNVFFLLDGIAQRFKNLLILFRRNNFMDFSVFAFFVKKAFSL